jgi:hypothetical protein
MKLMHSDLQDPVTNPLHRKIISYKTFGDDRYPDPAAAPRPSMILSDYWLRRDYEGGHGTHVVGSIVGCSMPTGFPGFDNGEHAVTHRTHRLFFSRSISAAQLQAPSGTTEWHLWPKSLFLTLKMKRQG